MVRVRADSHRCIGCVGNRESYSLLCSEFWELVPRPHWSPPKCGLPLDERPPRHLLDRGRTVVRRVVSRLCLGGPVAGSRTCGDLFVVD